MVVLGQAKCILPSSSVSPEQVARVVARLRRDWLGVYVTTGSFSRQAQVEIIDDQYPVVLISGGTLAAAVRQMAQANDGGDLEALLESTIDGHGTVATHRRPEEVLSMQVCRAHLARGLHWVRTTTKNGA
ncbi:restriction endonuclease [Nocardioides soli]|uniref:Restriction endonuclease Mrr n=1 Tax=Nocardioides soli TaxID=1036020 RepID=A0A7W4VYR3_9ACTN|nr:restriction endonuclease Mrr [Nocardioides soli]